MSGWSVIGVCFTRKIRRSAVHPPGNDFVPIKSTPGSLVNTQPLDCAQTVKALSAFAALAPLRLKYRPTEVEALPPNRYRTWFRLRPHFFLLRATD